jgi:DNA invertase Pin-like site-specific DNA recombinase
MAKKPSPRARAVQGALIGYARVSTADQKLGRQVDELNALGCSRIFKEKETGKKDDRPQLAKCLDHLRPGDTLVVIELSRLGRSLRHLVTTVAELKERGVGFRSIKEGIDTTGSAGRLVFGIFASLAEFERDLISERTKSGMAAAKKRGAKPGRPRVEENAKAAAARLLVENGSTVASACRDLGIGRSTYYRFAG